MAPKKQNPIKSVTQSLAFQFMPDKEVKGPRLVLGYFGIFLIVIGFLVLLPLLMLAFYPDESKNSAAFLVPGLIALVLGIGLVMLIFRRPKGKLTALEDLILVIGVWILVIIFSAIPFFFYGYTFTQAFFESTSGYTSAGLTIMDWGREITNGTAEGTTDVVNHMLFFHRALTELVGGIGLVLVVSSAISERSGLNLYLLEGHNDKLLPNLAKSARLIFGLYLGYIVVGTGLYILAGVTPFDAMCHSMTAVATGGFSTKSNNVNSLVMEVSMNGEWRGVMVELITELLMILGGTNFVIHYSLLRGRFNVLKHFEYWVFFFILLFVWPFMIVGFASYFNGNIAAGFRYGTFEMISGLSTAGFQAVDSYQAHAVVGTNFAIGSTGLYGYTNITSLSSVEMASGYASGSVVKFPTYLLFLLGLMMMIGMQNGSTTGAIKQNRIALLFMDVAWRVKAAVGKPDRHHTPMVWKFGNKVRVDRDEVIEAETFIAIYVAIVLFGTTLVSCIANGINLVRGDGTGDAFTWTDAFFEYSSAVGTVGLGCGITCYGNSISAGGQAILWIEMIGMLLGRLEIFVYFTLFGKIIHRIRNRKFIYNPDKEDNKIPDSKGKWDQSGSPL
jgi:trk system potassium uptake protein TrkH